jgi:hypothetical protein
VRTPPTAETVRKGRIPPTQLVDRSYLAYKDPVAGYVPIPPTQLVDRSYLAYGRKRPGFSESHQLHWWGALHRIPDVRRVVG